MPERREAILNELTITMTGAAVAKQIIEARLADKLQKGKPFTEHDLHDYLYAQIELELAAWAKEALENEGLQLEAALEYVRDKAKAEMHKYSTYQDGTTTLTTISRAIRENRHSVLKQFVDNTALLLEEDGQ